MAELFQGKIPVIRRDLNDGFMRGAPGTVSTGCVPRDFSIDPVMMRDSPDAMQVLDKSQWQAYFDAQEANKSSLQHIYLSGEGGAPAFEFLDQNGFPDCWAHSTAHALMLARIVAGLPPVRLNAVAVATMLNQTNGGWCGLSMKFAREHGYPVIGTGAGQWPYQSRRGSDTPELRAGMALHKSEEEWYDLGKREWDQTMADAQIATCTFDNCPVPSDYNKYGHSMLTLRYVPLDSGEWGRLTLNSWVQFGYHGLCVIPLSVARVDNAVAVRTVTASAA